MTEDLDSVLQQSALFGLADESTRRKLRARMERHEFEFGDELVSQGEAADAYYLIVQGRVRVLRFDRDGQEESLYRLEAGQSFGEVGLLYQGLRAATVRASDRVTVLRLSQAHFDEVVAESPGLRDQIAAAFCPPELSTYLRQYTEFADLPADALRTLWRGLTTYHHRAGKEVFRAGDPTGPMYIVQKGQVRIVQGGGRNRQLATLQPGDFFGEYSLLRGRPRSVTAIAEDDCALLALEPRHQARLLETYPGFRQVFSARAADYRFRFEAREPLDFYQYRPPSPEVDGVETALPDDPPAKAPDAGLPPVDQADDLARRRGRKRFEFVRQMDESDCGAAALAMVCRWFGRRVRLAYIRELSWTDAGGTRLGDLARAGAQLGLHVRVVRKAIDDPAELQLPAILHWENRHWVVMLETRSGKARIADPDAGLSWLPMDEVRRAWSGYAIECHYRPALETAPDEAGARIWLPPLIRRRLRYLLLAILFTCIISGLQLIVPYLTQVAMDDVILVALEQPVVELAQFRRLNEIVAILGSSLVCILLLTVAQRACLTRLAGGTDADLLNFLIDKMLSLPLSYFHRRRTGDIQRRLAGVRDLRDFLVHHSVGGVLAGLQIFAAVALMGFYSLSLTGLFLVIMLPVYIGLMFFAGKILRPAFVAIEASEAQYRAWQQEVIAGIAEVKATASEAYFKRSAVADFKRFTRDQQAGQFNISLYDGTVQAIWFLSIIVLLWLGARQVMMDELSTGKFIAMLILLALTYSPVMTIVRLWAEMQLARMQLARLTDLVEWPPEQPALPPQTLPVPNLQGKIDCRRVSLRYGGHDSPYVLRDVTFSVAPGSRVALVGRGGSGKSSLLTCLATLIEPTSGDVFYDGINVRTVPHPELRRHIGVVLAGTHVFSGNFTSNIAFGDDRPDLARVRWAATFVGLDGFIRGQPWGYDTPIGEGGLRLSRGQAQALAIARAVYRDSAVYILDEVTSELDVETAQLIEERLRDFCTGRTVIFTSRQLSTVREADQILVLDAGRIVEQGSHLSLLRRQGLYYQLFRNQLS